MTTSLRWGILATGGIAQAFTRDALLAGLNVTAVGSRSLESAARFAEEFGINSAYGSYEELAGADDVDIIYVATPHPGHAKAATLALNGGKHVLVEKPFTVNQREAAALRDLARERGLLVMEAMWTRYLPHMIRLREIIASGAIGEVRAVFADHTQALPTHPEHRLNSLELGGGALLDLGIYPISFVFDLLGQPTSIKASGRLGETGADTEVATVFTHASGAVSTTLSSSRAAGPDSAHIIGTEGRIDIHRVWYTPADFTVYNTAGEVVERYASDVSGRGMQFQAQAAERFVAEGRLDGDLLTIDDTVAIMGVLDEIRAQIGVAYPGE